ncbi:Methane oxygenase PmoA [Tangfeifania diversioriginum]|uniref:Methane oxygenase PmoA n=1 Tax=Tangfeifania diversioriginum TaxID=1168035 RepID=A0A1M6DT37_9BACT|nr:PmoA family protein [Tangfeifania diversioriginum]SHI76416.1 Methane oxygenase PmoA [Tangfeifania diversioriginum]
MKKFILLCLVLISTISLASAQPKVTAEKVGDKIEFRANGNLITSYIISEYEKYPFFFPVNGPSKANVTSMRNSLYPHHSSLFFGCDKVNGGNYWQEGLERGQIVSLRADILETGGEKAIVENECIWKRPGADAPIKDKRKISVSVPSSEKYQIDFEISMEMLMDVTIEKTNHSLFSGRMDMDLAVVNGGTVINARGEISEDGTFGKRSPWMDYHGERMGKTEGMAILQHPSNDWYPAPWFTRDYGFFSPTPMYWPENDKNIILKKGEQINLRYRVIVHTGDHEEAKIAQEFVKYSNE